MDDISIAVKGPVAAPPTTGYVADDVSRLKVGRVLGITNPFDGKFTRQLDYVISRVTSDGTEEMNKSLRRLMRIQAKVGSPRHSTGETWLSRVYIYLKTQSVADKAHGRFRKV